MLDLGCRPGSWLQYARKRTGERGVVVGLDRQPLEIVVPGARIVVGDVFQVRPEELRGDLEAFDCVLSDMAPDTSGVRAVDQARSAALFDRALDLAVALGAPGSNFVGKIFQGPDFKRLVDRVRAAYEDSAIEKPAGSRKESPELYVVGLGLRARR